MGSLALECPDQSLMCVGSGCVFISERKGEREGERGRVNMRGETRETGRERTRDDDERYNAKERDLGFSHL